MTRQALIHYHTKLWPAACRAQGWNPTDPAIRRAARAQCWTLIGIPHKGDTMPATDAEADALFLHLRTLAAPDNISLSMEFEKCATNYQAYSTAKKADYWEQRGYGPTGSRRLRQHRFPKRDTAQGSPIESPLTQTEANQRLWKFRQATRRREAATP